MSLIDRTEDVEFVDIPTEFGMSEEWKDQWTVFSNLFETLARKSRPVLFTGRHTPGLVNNVLELTDEENKNLESLQGEYDGLTRSGLRGRQEGLIPFLPINQIRKAFLSFNRRANYEWCFSRAVTAVYDYQHVREELAEYAGHLQLPEIDAPSFDTTFVTPFVKEAHLIISEWLAERYDHENNVINMPPYTILELGRAGPTPRRILTSINEDNTPDPGWVTLNLYNVRTLLENLSKVFIKYDIETHFNHAQAHVAGLKNMFRKEE